MNIFFFLATLLSLYWIELSSSQATLIIEKMLVVLSFIQKFQIHMYDFFVCFVLRNLSEMGRKEVQEGLCRIKQ